MGQKDKIMNALGMTFAICLVPATAFLIWLLTPWGKKWRKTLDEKYY